MSSTSRVLVVDDHDFWRRQICSVLRESGQWQVVGEASDGLGAIQKAEALKPDLILLDIGLPLLNGLEAARQILARDPTSRILFVTADPSSDIAEAALDAGARGYIVKSDVGRELLPAMETVVAGRRFIGAALTGRIFEQRTHGRAAHPLRRHEVGFYSDDRDLLDGYARFAASVLADGKSLIVVATDSRRSELHQRLRAEGADIDSAIKEGRWFFLDVAEVLSGFMVDGWPDEARFWKATTALILEAARASKAKAPRVAACGECAATLLLEGRVDAAIRLEQLWDELAVAYNVEILCPYSVKIAPHGDDSDILRKICAEHSTVLTG